LWAHDVALIVKRYALVAGLDPVEFSGHSLTAGFATSAAETGASVLTIMETTRHKSIDVLDAYVRRVDLFKDMIHPERSVLTRSAMNATPDNTSADPEQLIADLQRRLAEREAELAQCKAERDEALAQQTASTEVLPGHQFVTRRSHAGVWCHPRKGAEFVQRRIRRAVDL
jgi:hypothetical protein